MLNFFKTKTAVDLPPIIRKPKILLTVCVHIMLIITAIAADYPTLPQVFIQTPYSPPVGGQLITVNNSAAFQAALNTANLGDIIELQAAITFTGPFTLPNKTSGTGWIYIISSAYSSLPPPGTRVSPADAVNMPKIVVAAGLGGAINTASNAHHYRFAGIEFKPKAGNFIYNIINIGNGETSANSLPNNLVFDRCYIHGDPSVGSRRGVLMNGAYISVIDSYVSNCKEDGADSQALCAYSTTGPVKIVNNYLEGAGENVMFGGADPTIPNAVPSDIEIRRNHFFKPLSWMSQSWDVKNLLEFKNAQRVLVEGNHFENCWPDAQVGFALLLTPRNQDNTAPWSVVQDVTIRFNTFDNIEQGINMSGFDAPNISQRTSRILIQNNVLNTTGSNSRMFQVLSGPTDVIIDHNTGFCTNSYITADGAPKTDFFVFRNNIVSHGIYGGFIGSGTSNANTTLATFFNPNWEVTTNADISGSPANYPSGNFFPADTAAVGFVDFAAGDYHLSSQSPYNDLGTDGKDLGADIDSIAIVSTFGASPVADFTASATTICKKDKINFTDLSSNSPASWSWSFPGATPSTSTAQNPTDIKYTSTGTFSVTLTAANAIGSDAETKTGYITVNALPTATVTPGGPTIFCDGGSVLLSATTGAGLTYKWKNGNATISGATSSTYMADATGSYKVVVTNASGCSKTSNAISVTENPRPAASITPDGPTTFCPGDSVILTANSGAGYTYKWKKGGSIIPGATAISYTAKISGTYKVVVTNSFGCSKASAGIVVTAVCKLTEDIMTTRFFTLYPNPSASSFTVAVNNDDKKDLSLKIFDATGRIVQQSEISNELTSFTSGEDLLPGIYLVEFTYGGYTEFVKWIKVE